MPAMENLPEYVSRSVGQPAFGQIGIRLRDLVAFMAAQGMNDVAEQLAVAYGALRARLLAGELANH